MPEREVSPYHQALEEIPQGKSEKIAEFLALNRFVVPVGMGAVIILNPSLSMPNRVASVAISATAAIADNLSTQKMLRAMQEADTLGVEIHHMEMNQRTQDEWDKRGNISRSPKEFAVNAVTTIASGFLGFIVSIPISGPRFPFAISNSRIAKRYRRAAEIAREREQD